MAKILVRKTLEGAATALNRDRKARAAVIPGREFPTRAEVVVRSFEDMGWALRVLGRHSDRDGDFVFGTHLGLRVTGLKPQTVARRLRKAR